VRGLPPGIYGGRWDLRVADGELYSDFAGPAMQKGDFWKIYLGRRVVLDEQDVDGSAFIEGLLEDVLMFSSSEGWETVEETPGIWVTRPIALGDPDQPILESESDDDSDGDFDYDMEDADDTRVSPIPEPTNSGPVICIDRYDTLDDEEIGNDEAGGVPDIKIVGDVAMVDDPGFTWTAGIPDGNWPGLMSADEGDEEGGGDQMSTVTNEDDRGSSDEAGSDFDSDEVLSGDEDAIATGSKYFKVSETATLGPLALL
jgi:hypothetical protein